MSSKRRRFSGEQKAKIALEALRGDLHCGGMDTDEPLPAFLRREYFLNITVGVVACEDHPLLAGTPTDADLADCPWIDYDAPLPAATVALADPDRPSSLDRLLDGLFHETGRRVSTVLRARAAGLYLMATGSWLAWLPLNFLERLTGPRLSGASASRESGISRMSGSAPGAMKFMRTSFDGVWKWTDGASGERLPPPRPRRPDRRPAPLLALLRAGAGGAGGTVDASRDGGRNRRQGRRDRRNAVRPATTGLPPSEVTM